MVREYSKDKRIRLLEAKIKMLDCILLGVIITGVAIVSFDLLLYAFKG